MVGRLSEVVAIASHFSPAVGPLRALIFDFDGLILDTEYPEYVSWSEVYERFGFTLPIAEWASAIGMGASTIKKTPYDDLDERLGRPIDRDAIRAVRRRRFAELMEAETTLPGVEALIADAERHGVKCGVASSSPREWVAGYLERLGLRERFQAICCGDEVEWAKPAPDLYLAALAALGVAAGEAVALEDSPNGIAAARAAGLFCVAIPNAVTRHTSLAAPMSVKSLSELSVERLAGVLAPSLSPNES